MAGELAIVLAAPERKRILRELLAREGVWSLADCELYRNMIVNESQYVMRRWIFDDDILADTERYLFTGLVIRGTPAAEALDLAHRGAKQELRRQTPTDGQRERDRRRTFKEAVTASDGALAVTTGLVRSCIVCNGPFSIPKGRRYVREDSAYCSNACRQAAYRRRRKAG